VLQNPQQVLLLLALQQYQLSHGRRGLLGLGAQGR
jgi:hypothetical protein